MDSLFCGEMTALPMDSFESNDSATTNSSDDDQPLQDPQEVILECDYDTCPTKLYQAVEEKQWEEIAVFLDTGIWNTSSWMSFGGIFGGNDHDPPSVEARTWVTALDTDGQVRWCQLPLHAAITFQAPPAIIQKLLAVYPKSARCADDQGLLPLHYAFRFGSPDDIVWLILQAFPQAIRKKAARNRMPLDLSPFSLKPERGYIIERFVEYAIKSAKDEWDIENEAMLQQQQQQQQQQQRYLQQQRGGKNHPVDPDVVNQELGRRLYRKSQKLSRAMKELKQTQTQLDQLKQKLKEGTAAAAVSSATPTPVAAVMNRARSLVSVPMARAKASATVPPAPARAKGPVKGPLQVRITSIKEEGSEELDDILGPAKYDVDDRNSGEDKHDKDDKLEDRDDREENEGEEDNDGIVDDDQTAILAPQQQEEELRRKVSMSTSNNKQFIRTQSREKNSITKHDEEASSPRFLLSMDDRSRRSIRTDDRSRRSARTSADQSNHSRRSVHRSRSKSRARKTSVEPAAKKAIRNIFHGLRAKVQKTPGQ